MENARGGALRGLSPARDSALAVPALQESSEMSSEGPSKILTPRGGLLPYRSANAVAAAQLFEITHWLGTYLLRKGFAVEPLDDRDCVAQGTDQTLRGEKEKLPQSVLLLPQSVNDQ